MLKKLLSALIVLSIVLANFSMVVYAVSIPVTKDNLNETFQKFISSGSNDKNYKISVSKDTITIRSDDGECTLTYDLIGNPTFTNTVQIKKGMSYDKFNEATGNLSSPMLGYIAVANIQGVEFEDSLMYFAMYMLQAAFSGLSSMDMSESYMIVSDDVIVDGDNSKIIKESEFGKHVIDYAKSLYGNSQSINDSDAINSFEMKSSLENVTSSSCEIVTTLTVNLNADFSQIKNLSESLQDAFSQFSDASKLSDIDGTRYETAIKKLVDLGVVNGFEDGTFRPTENVTRAQFAKMLVTSRNLKMNSTSTKLQFTDLAEEHWAYNYVKVAVDNGIINGYPDGTFGPENSVTYAEVMAMILRAMNLESKMTDRSWPMGYINEAKKVGLLDSVDYSNPDVAANRGETAICLFNMLNKIAEERTANTDALNATYSNKNGNITLEELEDGSVDFTFSGMVNDVIWLLGMQLEYSNGIASVEESFLDDVVKIKVVFGNGEITVEASSTDPKSGYNGISGTYKLDT